MGLDLGAVRVHVGSSAEAAAHAQQAHAFTHGSHVVLGREAQRASSPARARILAHELVHVGQQAAPTISGAAPHRPRERAPPGVQRLPEDDTSIVPAFLSDAASAVAEFGADVAESAEAAIERVAPGLLDLLRGGITRRITELLCTSVDAFVGQAFAQIGEIDFMTPIEKRFTELAADARQVQTDLKVGMGTALGVVLRPLIKLARAFADPVIWLLQWVSDAIDGLVGGLWDNLAKPVLDFLGVAALQTLVDMANLVWAMTWPVRALGSLAWDWLKETFGLDWSGEGGVLDTLRAVAKDVWDDFTKTFEPIKKPLMEIGGVLVLLSPLGPIVVLADVIPPLWDKVKWIYEAFNSKDVLAWGHAILAEEVLPAIMGGVGGVAAALAGATDWLAGLLVGFAAPMQDALAAFGASRCLTAAVRYLLGISAQYQRLALWALGGFDGLAPALFAVFDALKAILAPILDFCVRLGMVAVNPWLLPTVLEATAWLLCPPDLKAEVINLVLDLLIAGINAFPALFLELGPLAVLVKAGVLGFLDHLRYGKDVTDDVRVAAGDKIAGIAAGGGLAFIGGFTIGLLEGLLDGIIDPFRLIFMIFKFVVLAFNAVGRALAPIAHWAPVVGPWLEDASARAPPQEEQAPDEAALQQQARDEVKAQGSTITGLADLLAAAWEWMMSAAAGLGAMIAGALLGFLALSDYELGSKLGFLTGFILLQALIIYLSAGEYAVLKGLEPAIREAIILLLKFLDLGGQILGAIGKVVGPFLAPIGRGIAAAGRFVAKVPFVKAILEAIEHWIGRITRGIEELGLFGERAAGKAAQTGERAAADVAAQGEKAVVREADEAAATAARDLALKGEQMVEAEATLSGFVELNDLLNTPVPVLIAGLYALKAERYRWIDSFIAEPLPTPGHYRIEFTASPGHTLKADYTTGPVTPDDIKALLSEVKKMNDLRRHALDIINRLPPGQRRRLLRGLAEADPELAAKTLTHIGRFKDEKELLEFVQDAPEELNAIQLFLLEEGKQVVETGAEVGVKIEQTVVRRVSEEELQLARGVLKDRLPPPWWAHGNPRAYNAHHVIPVELQDHWVFKELRATPQGWDHNAAINGFPLPVTEAAAKESGLPLHQLSKDVLKKMRAERGITGEVPTGLIVDLRGHPQWNLLVKRELDALAHLRGNPAALRSEVDRILVKLKGDLEASGWEVLF